MECPSNLSPLCALKLMDVLVEHADGVCRPVCMNECLEKVRVAGEMVFEPTQVPTATDIKYGR